MILVEEGAPGPIRSLSARSAPVAPVPDAVPGRQAAWHSHSESVTRDSRAGT